MACYFLAFTIFTLGLLRDYLFNAVCEEYKNDLLNTPFVKMISLALLIVGNVFVTSSMYKLGITGTYLGMYMHVACVYFRRLLRYTHG